MNEEKQEQVINSTNTINTGSNQNGNNGYNQNSTMVNPGQATMNSNTNNQMVNNHLQNQNAAPINNSINKSECTFSQQLNVADKPTSTMPNHNDFEGVIDPSKITVGPEAIHPQIPVNNETEANQAVNNNKEPKKNNTFSLILVFLLFLGIGAFIYFMPEIHQMLNNKKPNQEQSKVIHEEKTPEQEQTTSYNSMICSQISNTYTIYSQEDHLKKYSISTVYTSDIDKNYQACLTLQQSEVVGFIVGCDKTANNVTMVKTYDFTSLPDSFAGSVDFKKDDSVKNIKKSLEQKGYTCS